MYRHVLNVLLAVLLVAPALLSAETPEPGEILDRMIAAAGGESFAKIGVLKLEVRQEETHNDGTGTTRTYTAYIDTANLENQRIEYPGDVIVAHHGAGGWSTKGGKLDDRPQTSRMAETALNQALFTLLLPHSLKMEGVWVKEVRETTLDGRKVWVLLIPFAKGFFTSPVMTTTWMMVVAQDDYSILVYEFIPPVQYQDVSPMGIRYRILKQQEVEGATLTEQLLLIGINAAGVESGANRVTKVKASTAPWDATLFLSPAQLEALEQED
jgi:hypothetical protein